MSLRKIVTDRKPNVVPHSVRLVLTAWEREGVSGDNLIKIQADHARGHGVPDGIRAEASFLGLLDEVQYTWTWWEVEL